MLADADAAFHESSVPALGCTTPVKAGVVNMHPVPQSQPNEQVVHHPPIGSFTAGTAVDTMPWTSLHHKLPKCITIPIHCFDLMISLQYFAPLLGEVKSPVLLAILSAASLPSSAAGASERYTSRLPCSRL